MFSYISNKHILQYLYFYIFFEILIAYLPPEKNIYAISIFNASCYLFFKWWKNKYMFLLSIILRLISQTVSIPHRTSIAFKYRLIIKLGSLWGIIGSGEKYIKKQIIFHPKNTKFRLSYCKINSGPKNKK